MTIKHALLTVEQYASQIRVTPQAVRYQCKHGKLADGYTAQKVGGTWIISKSS